jgi:hypothetical protein
MEKAQRQGTAAVTDTHQQAAPPPETDFSQIHFTLYHHVLTGLHCPHGGDPGTILIACRQVKQHILQRADIQSLQTLRNARSHTLEHGDRERIEIVGCLTQGFRLVSTRG